MSNLLSLAFKTDEICVTQRPDENDWIDWAIEPGQENLHFVSVIVWHNYFCLF